jgi:arabinose-5-phosphate isomerase
MPVVLAEISGKRLGMTCVTNPDKRLAGIITDGDIRRHLIDGDLLRRRAADVMTAAPITIERSLLAVAALAIMERGKITSLVVIDADRRVEGVLHLHDLWRTQMF